MVIIDVNKIPFFSPLLVKKPAIVVAHHFFGKAIFIESSFPVAMYVYLTEKLFLHLYRRYTFIVGSPSTYKELVHEGVIPEKVNIVNYCVDHNVYRLTGVEKSKTPLIGYLGRVKKYKSVEHLIRAFPLIRQMVPDARLLIIGEGDNMPSIKLEAEKTGLMDYIEFKGFVSDEEKIEHLQKCWLVVNPSSKEGWGLTVVEANACGTPCVASNVQGLRDAVKDGETGLLFEYGNISDLAEKAASLLTDEAQRSRLRDGGLNWASEFDWDVAAKKTLDLIYSELKKK